MTQWKRKCEEVSEELSGLGEVRNTVQGLQKETQTLINRNKVTACFCGVSIATFPLLCVVHGM